MGGDFAEGVLVDGGHARDYRGRLSSDMCIGVGGGQAAGPQIYSARFGGGGSEDGEGEGRIARVLRNVISSHSDLSALTRSHRLYSFSGDVSRPDHRTPLGMLVRDVCLCQLVVTPQHTGYDSETGWCLVTLD